MRFYSVSKIVVLIRFFLFYILLFSGVIEILFFSSWDNFIGIIVSLISYALYAKYVFRIGIMRTRPISFIAFSTLILFMYLPLPLTLLDGNEMSHHLFDPRLTYSLQFLYFCCCILAFTISGVLLKSHRGLSKVLKNIGYFATPSNIQLWVLGIIGWGVKFVMLSSQFPGEGVYQAGFGTLSVFAVLINAPLLILFKELLGGVPASKKQKVIVVLYMVAMMVILISSNSRSQVITSFIIFLICYLFGQFYRKKVVLSKSKVIFTTLLLIIISGPLSDLAFAMVIARAQRQNTKFTVLLESTLKIYNDKEKLYKLKQIADSRIANSKSSKTIDWDEFYVSSIFFNRVCNYRVVDATIYHAQKVGIPNSSMMDDFLTHLSLSFPQPIVNLLGGPSDKSKYAYSPMDKLYAISSNRPLMAGYRVGGDIGLSLSIFGIFAFLITFIVYLLEFLLFDNLICKRRGKIVFPFLILVSIYPTFFLCFQVGGGILSHISFLCWGFPFELVALLFVYKMVKLITPNARNKI